jgi:hypothetical protein
MSAESVPRIDVNSGPQTGMSEFPCGGFFTPFRSTSSTYESGNCPPWRWASVVKSGGGVLSSVANGPWPFKSIPWHAAQYCFMESRAGHRIRPRQVCSFLLLGRGSCTEAKNRKQDKHQKSICLASRQARFKRRKNHPVVNMPSSAQFSADAYRPQQGRS